MDSSLLKDPHRSVLTELAKNPEVQELIASALKQRELLIDRVIALAGEKGVKLKKVPEHTIVDTVASEHKIAKADYNLNLSEWLTSKNLSWSKLTAA